jgi:hypothetical protein
MVGVLSPAVAGAASAAAQTATARNVLSIGLAERRLTRGIADAPTLLSTVPRLPVRRLRLRVAIYIFMPGMVSGAAGLAGVSFPGAGVFVWPPGISAFCPAMKVGSADGTNRTTMP